MSKSFLVLFFKKEQHFFLKKEAKTFICWLSHQQTNRRLRRNSLAAAGEA